MVGSGIRKKPIPDPGSGSATLETSNPHLEWVSQYCICSILYMKLYQIGLHNTGRRYSRRKQGQPTTIARERELRNNLRNYPKVGDHVTLRYLCSVLKKSVPTYWCAIRHVDGMKPKPRPRAISWWQAGERDYLSVCCETQHPACRRNNTYNPLNSDRNRTDRK